MYQFVPELATTKTSISGKIDEETYEPKPCYVFYACREVDDFGATICQQDTTINGYSPFVSEKYPQGASCQIGSGV